MRPRPVRTAAAALVLAAVGAVAARPAGPLPALGPLLDPTRGLWANARAAEPPAAQTLALPGLRGRVEVRVDDRRVPHIFAEHEEDAYRALGYVVARDRLLQLHVQTLASSGRLTELAGPRALPFDQETRRLGLTRAADRQMRTLGDTSASARVLRAYGDGINAYVDGLAPGDVPVEFKLLGLRPARWEPINSVHLINRMGYILAYQAPELDRAQAAARVGEAAADALFPARAPIVEPIQPNGQRSPRVDTLRLPPPGKGSYAAARAAAAFASFFPTRAAATVPEERPSLASNNWAVAPRRSATGHALLAGDPHLELTLPSIWYEAHLVVPGRLDVYGVTIPGLPGVVIGFNRDLAWTFTNTGADVIDYYAERVDDDRRPTRYLLDGAWRPLERRVETYRGKDGAVVGVDTLLFTHRGPLRRVTAVDLPVRAVQPYRDRRNDLPWVSMRWTVLEDREPLAAFRAANASATTRAFLDVLAAGYASPAQNMLVADRRGSIGIRSTGRYPVRPVDGSGLTVRDGRARAADWTGALPVERWPQSVDPAQGFLASANQQPIDPRATGDYWGGGYEPWRAMRINALLRADSSVTVDDMRRWQTDPGSERANLFVPHFLRAAERVVMRGGPDAPDVRAAAQRLAEWDRRYDTASTRAVLFEAAMDALRERTWDELAMPGYLDSTKAAPFRRSALPLPRAATPSSAVLAALLGDSANVWWDRRDTPDWRETRDDVLVGSLVAADRQLHARVDLSAGDGWWRWARHRRANIDHLLRLPALSRRGLPVQGGPGTLSPSFGSGTHGASWRMVVELGPDVRAWATYPGGQSGDPTSPRYTDRLPRWLAGELDPVRFPRRAADLPAAQVTHALTLTPATR